MNATGLLAAARQVLDQPQAATTGLWPRVVALLTRQALEKALNDFWEARPATAGLSRCPGRSQLACLPSYLKADIAREVVYVWSALSEACHYRAYELAPTAAELRRWINAVAQLMESMRDTVPSSSLMADLLQS